MRLPTCTKDWGSNELDICHNGCSVAKFVFADRVHNVVLVEGQTDKHGGAGAR